MLLARKGVEAHKKILEAYMSGMDIKAEDRLLVVDLVPNRQGFKTVDGVTLFFPTRP